MKPMHHSILGRFGLALLLASPVSGALAQTSDLVIASNTGLVNHYPGPDGLVGTDDDVVSDDPTTVNGSFANIAGSYGFNAFAFAPSPAPEPKLPAGFDAVTFVNGGVTIDKGVFASGGGAVVTALDITSGTEPFPGHGPYTSTITAVNGGTYNTGTHEYTLNVDFQYTIFGSNGTEPGVALSGIAIYQAAADFGTNTGNDYFENVVKPLAVARGASGALFMTSTGSLTNLGFPINQAIVALEGADFVINAGLNDAWVADNAPFQGLFFTVFEDITALFLSWFTFDTVVPGVDNATFGASDQRWVTGLGFYAGNTVTVSVELTSGGIFNGSEPEATQTPNYGTIKIEFVNCNLAVLTYNFPGLNLMGQIWLHRVVPDNVAMCETLAAP